MPRPKAATSEFRTFAAVGARRVDRPHVLTHVPASWMRLTLTPAAARHAAGQGATCADARRDLAGCNGRTWSGTAWVTQALRRYGQTRPPLQ